MNTVDILKERAEILQKNIARKEADLNADKAKLGVMRIDIFKATTGIIEGTRIKVFTKKKLEYEGRVTGFYIGRDGAILPKGVKINKDGQPGKREFMVDVQNTFEVSSPTSVKKIKWRLE
jgi:hypothetical protein